ncbi:MAG TPA: SAM-dependent methyltransferase [bacterium]|nr:SAM-dependent methyltransferase [bacterium]
MKQNQASGTAGYMTLFRALESYRPEAERLFEDTMAVGFLKPSLRRAACLSRIPVVGEVVRWYIDKQWPGARTSGIARTRFIDDELINALKNGVKQVVILGAGFDSRAYRIPGIERAQVYEVDYPSTLEAKRDKVQKMLGRIPGNVTFSEIDFNHQRLGDLLAGSGFDQRRRSFFIWEGVTNYLTPQAVDVTLRFIGGMPEGSVAVFTYIHKGVLDRPESFEGTQNLARLLRENSEPWTFGLYPKELPAYLEARRLRLVEDIGATEYRAKYMRSERCKKGYEFYRIAIARVDRSSHPRGGSSLTAHDRRRRDSFTEPLG